MTPRSASDNRLLPAPIPAAAKATYSPSALILASGGVAAGVVLGLPLLAAVALGVCLWGVRVGTGAALAASRRNAATRPEPIDPYAVPEPWRGFVAESLSAQTRFDQAVSRSRPGPLRDRLGEISLRVHDGTRECWRVAHLGAALHAQLRILDPSAASAELRRYQQDRALRSPKQDVASTDAGTEAALAARLQAARQIEAAHQRAADRVGIFTAGLHGAVARALELAIDGSNAAGTQQLAGTVESVVADLETLRRALEETGSTRAAIGDHSSF